MANWSSSASVSGVSSSGLSCVTAASTGSLGHGDIITSGRPSCTAKMTCRGLMPPPPSGRVPASSAATICHRRWSPTHGDVTRQCSDLAGVKRPAEIDTMSQIFARPTRSTRIFTSVPHSDGRNEAVEVPRSEIRGELCNQVGPLLVARVYSRPGSGSTARPAGPRASKSSRLSITCWPGPIG